MNVHENVNSKASYLIHLRCHDCLTVGIRAVDVPDVEEAPDDVEELLQSELLRHIPFICGKCEGVIASVVAVAEGENIL